MGWAQQLPSASPPGAARTRARRIGESRAVAYFVFFGRFAAALVVLPELSRVAAAAPLLVAM